MQTISYTNFGQPASGQVVTQHYQNVVVYARNPYGSHNLVIVDLSKREAYRHGDLTVLVYLLSWDLKKAYRRARRFLAAKKKLLDVSLIQES